MALKIRLLSPKKQLPSSDGLLEEKQFAGQTGTLSIPAFSSGTGHTGYEQESPERHGGHTCVTPSRPKECGECKTFRTGVALATPTQPRQSRTAG
jgi:hypothetical protein